MNIVFRSFVVVALMAMSTMSVLAQSQSSPTDVSQSITLKQPAQVEPYERASIVAKASGFVSMVHADIGDRVKKGDLLAELSIPEMEQERLQKEALVERAKAAIRQAEARVAASQARVSAAQSQMAAVKAHLEKYLADIQFARSELGRITTLVSSRAVNAAMQDEKQQQLHAAEAALQSGEADVDSADSGILVAKADQTQAEADLAFSQAELKVAEANLAHTEALMNYAAIRAPFDGAISYRGIDTGDFVLSAASSVGEPLFTLNRIDRFRIVFDVPESTAALVKLGQTVELRVDSLNDHVFLGEIKRTAGELDKRTRTLRVEAEVIDREHKLQPGMYGMVTTTIPR